MLYEVITSPISAGRAAAPLVPSTFGGVLAALATLLAGTGVGLWIANLTHRKLGTQWIEWSSICP